MESYAIANVESAVDDGFYARLRRLSDARVSFVQLRAPGATARSLYEIALRSRSVIGSGTKLIVNRRADIAVAARADGVHLPSAGIPAIAARMSAPGLIIGRSCHSTNDARIAAEEEVDYILLGPLFPTRSKVGEARVSREMMTEAAKAGPPVFALGGISVANLQEAGALPVAGLAAITLFMHDEPLEEIVETIRSL